MGYIKQEGVGAMNDHQKELVKWGREQCALMGYPVSDWSDEEVLNLVVNNWGVS